MFNYRSGSTGFLLLVTCSSTVVLGACLAHLLVKSQHGIEENKTMPKQNSLINPVINPVIQHRACEFRLQKPEGLIGKLTRLFTGSVDEEKEAVNALQNVMQEIYQGELKYSQDMQEVDELRVGFIDEQHAVNTRLHAIDTKLRERIRALQAVSTNPSRSVVTLSDKKVPSSATEVRSIEESQAQLQALKDEWDHYELPDLKFKTLNIPEMVSYKKRLEGDVIMRNELHRRILISATEHIKLISEYYERSRVGIEAHQLSKPSVNPR